MLYITRMLIVCTAVALAVIVDSALFTWVQYCVFAGPNPPAGFAKIMLFMWKLIRLLPHVWELILPSILIFLLSERLLPRHPGAKHLAFILSLLPYTAFVSYAFFETSAERPHPFYICRIVFYYLSQGMAAYIMLIVTSPRKPTVRTGE